MCCGRRLDSQNRVQIILPDTLMTYTNSAFFLFFVVVFVLYYVARQARLQVMILIIASLFFYAWNSLPLLLVFLLSWLITSLSSYGVLATNELSRKKLYAVTGVVANLCLLGFFKYKFLVINGTSTQSDYEPHSIGEWLIQAPLPIGISFYTFHGISLLV